MVTVVEESSVVSLLRLAHWYHLSVHFLHLNVVRGRGDRMVLEGRSVVSSVRVCDSGLLD